MLNKSLASGYDHVLPYTNSNPAGTGGAAEIMKHTLSVLVEDEAGVLTRIAGLFARRGFNIESLAVGPAEQMGVSRITMVVPGDDQVIEQLTKQLYKLINVLKVQDITEEIGRAHV